MVLNVVGSNPIGHPSSNPLQLCVVRDFFVCLPPPPLPPCCPPAQPQCDKTPVAAHSQRAPFPRALPLLSPLCVSNGLYPSGKCRPPTCPLAHVPQCRWQPKTIYLALSSYAKPTKSSAWVGKGCPGADAFLEKTVGTCRNVHFLARGSACAHRIFRFLPSPFTCLCKTQ